MHEVAGKELAWIKEMSGLSLISLLGNVSCVGGMAVVAQFATQMPSQLAALPTWNPATFPQWFGRRSTLRVRKRWSPP